jgi:hypothetical protein
MAGTVTVTSMSNPYANDGINKIIIDWLSTAGGAASGAICSLFSAAQLAKFGYSTPQPSKIQGKLIKIETIPGLNGDLTTTLPTAAYDLTLLDSYGNDIASGYAKDRSGTVVEQFIPVQPVVVDDEITLTIADAGATTTGRVILHFKKG